MGAGGSVPASKEEALGRGHSIEEIEAYLKGTPAAADASATAGAEAPLADQGGGGSRAYFIDVVDPVMRQLLRSLKRDRPAKVPPPRVAGPVLLLSHSLTPRNN